MEIDAEAVRAGLAGDVATFPRVERDGHGLRAGAEIGVTEFTPDGVLVRVRLPGWDHVDLFDERDDDPFELTTEVRWADCLDPTRLKLTDVARAVRRDHGLDAYAAAFAAWQRPSR